MKRLALLTAAGIGLGAALVAVSAIGVVSTPRPTASAPVVAKPAAFVSTSGQTLDELIASLEVRVGVHPDDDRALATLGLAYVQQAHVTNNGDLYASAEDVLQRSLEANDGDNFLAYAGLAALHNAQHDFAVARDYALKGLEINAHSTLLYGALGDAELQLGHYDAAFDAIQTMVDLSPDTASLARASYTWELRGDVDRATELMERALADAPTPADRSFALLHLGDLELAHGDANEALRLYNDALAARPESAAALAGKAAAEAELGQTQTARAHYEELIARGLEPFYILRYAELLDSLGCTAEAEAHYAEYERQESVHAAREVQPDPTFILFYADHGQPESALELAEKALANGAFVEMWDAYAWALYRNGRIAEAADAIDNALVLGTRNERILAHAAAIDAAVAGVS